MLAEAKFESKIMRRQDKGILFSTDNKSVNDYSDVDNGVISHGYGQYFKP